MNARPQVLLLTAAALAALAAVTVVAPVPGVPAHAAESAPPRVVQTVAAPTSTDRAALPSWSPVDGELLLVGVATQAWRDLPVRVTGNGLAFEHVGRVRNAQGVGRLDVFRAQGRPVAGAVGVTLSGNRGPASVIAMRVDGVPVGGNGADALRDVVFGAGPTASQGDDGDMRARVDALPGDLVLAFGTHRSRRFTPPSGQSGKATNVWSGSGGERIAASAWSADESAATTIGGTGVLAGGSGTDDWAIAGLALAPILKLDPAPSPSPTPTTPSPSPAGPGQPAENLPYAPDAAWNAPIGPNPQVPADSVKLVRSISDNGLALTSDPDQYTLPVYRVDASTPRRTVSLSGHFGAYDTSDAKRVGFGASPVVRDVPIPDGVTQGAGADGQLVILDPVAGIEYGFFQFSRDGSGNYRATNGYRYRTTPGFGGRFADGKAGRGAGTPYLAGLVRAWEVDQGRIDHALAFAYQAPSRQFVFPASKSDGGGQIGTDLPEGTRLQLNPDLTEAQLAAYGLNPKARIIARALQRYGMITVDNSGSSKVYLEDRTTARWPADVNRGMLSGLPWSQFRVVTQPG